MTNKQLLIRPLLAILMALFALNTWATDPREDLYLTAERLFHISRSVNRNLVCYDAHLTDNGQLVTDEPINVYWVNREERPQPRGTTRRKEWTELLPTEDGLRLQGGR